MSGRGGAPLEGTSPRFEAGGGEPAVARPHGRGARATRARLARRSRQPAR
jgi:hypothetical protein